VQRADICGTDTNQIAEFGGWDDLGAAVPREFMAAVQLDNPQSIDRISLWANVGETAVLTGQGSDPVIEMRYSRDQGKRWSDLVSGVSGSRGRVSYRAIVASVGDVRLSRRDVRLSYVRSGSAQDQRGQGQ
jgi:hypothetical protein